MHSLVFLMLWIPYGPPGGSALPPAGHHNVVRICSLAAGDCQDLNARALEPSQGPGAAGQRAFIDPETLSVVQPTEEQVEDLSLIVAVDESLVKQQETKVETLPNGTLKLSPGKSFAVFRKAVLQKKEGKP